MSRGARGGGGEDEQADGDGMRVTGTWARGDGGWADGRGMPLVCAQGWKGLVLIIP